MTRRRRIAALHPTPEELQAEFPELSQLTERELDAYIIAVHKRRAVANLGLGIGSLVLGTLVFIPIAAVGFIISASPGPSSNRLSDLLWALGGLVAAAVVAWRVVSRYRRRFQLGVFTQHLRHTADCAGCNYDLSGVAALPARPAVIRCPECGLLNPAGPTHAVS